jgi:hypothetical protein
MERKEDCKKQSTSKRKIKNLRIERREKKCKRKETKNEQTNEK